MILGSFNWLSFGGNADRDGESRGETSNINKNLESIRKEKAKFIEFLSFLWFNIISFHRVIVMLSIEKRESES